MKALLITSRIVFACTYTLIIGVTAAPFSQRARPDAGLIAAPHSLSNYLEKGITTGTFDALCPGVYPGYGWAREVREIGSNGLFQGEYLVFDETQAAHSQHALHGTPLAILLFRPDSKPGSATRGFAAPWSPPAFHSSLSGRRRGPESAAQSALLAVGEALLGVQYSVANLGHYLFLSDSESLTFTAQLALTADAFELNEGRVKMPLSDTWSRRKNGMVVVPLEDQETLLSWIDSYLRPLPGASPHYTVKGWLDGL